MKRLTKRIISPNILTMIYTYILLLLICSSVVSSLRSSNQKKSSLKSSNLPPKFPAFSLHFCGEGLEDWVRQWSTFGNKEFHSTSYPDLENLQIAHKALSQGPSTIKETLEKLHASGIFLSFWVVVSGVGMVK